MKSNIKISPDEQIALDFEAAQNKSEEISSPSTSIPTSEEIKVVEKDINLEKQYGDQNIKAAAAGIARGVTFGISDQILVKGGFTTPQTLREIEERNKTASILGEVAGIAAPTILTAGAAGAASLISKTAGSAIKGVAAAGKATEELTAKAIDKIIGLSGNKALASSIIEKGISKAAGSAVEGGFYGAGQLISEDALGTKEFNAENLLASVGTGAIIGGIAGGAFGTLEAIIPTVSKTGEIVVSKGKKFADPEGASLELIGMTPAKINKINKVNPTFVKDLPSFLTKEADLGLLTSDRKLTEVVSNIKDKAGLEIGNILKEMEAVSKETPSILPDKKTLYTNIISSIDKNFIERYKNIPEYADKLNPIKHLRDDYDKLASSAEGKFSPIELNNVRKDLDEVIKYDKIPGTTTLLDKVNKGTRGILRTELDNIADKASKTPGLEGSRSLFDRLKEENKRFSTAVTALPYLEGKLNKSSLLSTMDVLRGGVGFGVLGSVGVAGAVAYKLAQSDLARKMKILTQIEKANQSVTSKVEKSVSSFLSNIKPVAVPTSTNVLLETAYGRKDINGSKPKDRKEAFANMQENFKKFQTNPDSMFENLNKNTLRLAKHTPETSLAVASTITNAISFLESRMPKDLRTPGIVDFKRPAWQPSTTELAKFSRYVEAVEHPLNVIRDIGTGSVSPEQVETLRMVYPNLYTRVQKEVLDGIASSKEPIPYKKRLQLGLLLDIPTDASLQSSYIRSMQSTFIPKEEQPTQPSIKPEKLKGPDVASSVEKIQRRP